MSFLFVFIRRGVLLAHKLCTAEDHNNQEKKKATQRILLGDQGLTPEIIFDLIFRSEVSHTGFLYLSSAGVKNSAHSRQTFLSLRQEGNVLICFSPMKALR